MTEPRIKHDEPSDTLYIAFAPGKSVTGIELNEHILLRIDLQGRTAVGLTLFDFSLLAQHTEMGPRSFPLSGLAALPEETRELALEILLSEPVCDFLMLSAYSSTAYETVPIATVRAERLTHRVAPRPLRRPGSARGLIHMADDFDEFDPEPFLGRVRQLRQSTSLPPLTDDLLKKAIEEDRP